MAKKVNLRLYSRCSRFIISHINFIRFPDVGLPQLSSPSRALIVWLPICHLQMDYFDILESLSCTFSQWLWLATHKLVKLDDLTRFGLSSGQPAILHVMCSTLTDLKFPPMMPLNSAIFGLVPNNAELIC